MAIFHARTKSSKSPKKNQSKKLQEAKAKHQKYIDSLGLSKPTHSNPNNFPDLSVDRKGAELSNTIPDNGFRRSVYDYRWRKDRQETEQAILEAERKRSRVAPLWNKGGVMYITDDQDPTTLGKKV